MVKQVVIVGGGASARHTAEQLLKKASDAQVTIVSANQFLEWPIAMPFVLADPTLHSKALSVNPEDFEEKGLQYKYGVVTNVDPTAKSVTVKGIAKGGEEGSSETVQYDALILATGFSMPLIYPALGSTLEDRQAEVLKAGAAIKAATTVVVSGGGVVGLEVSSQIRAAHPTKKVVLLARSRIMPGYPDKVIQKVEAQLKVQGIELVVGSITGAPDMYSLEAGSVEVGGNKVEYDVFLPMYSRGPNTSFLKANAATALNDNGTVKVNQYLQSSAFKEIFAVGVGDQQSPFIGFIKLTPMWDVVATNVASLVNGKEVAKVYKEGQPAITHPPNLLLGSGSTAWGIFDFSAMPGGVKFCCCGGMGGFPFCPPPCCWVCCSPCCCGYCCGPPEGKGPAKFMEPLPLKFASKHQKGVGQPPKQQTM